MRMKKNTSIFIVAILLILSLMTGCVSGNVETEPNSGNESNESGDSAAKDTEKTLEEFITQESDNPDKIVLRYASTSSNLNDHPYMRGFRKFFEVLKTELGDKIEIQFYLNGSLGTSTDAILGGLQNQSFELTDWPLGSFAELTNAFQPFDVPYLITSPDEAMDLLNGEVGEIMREKCIEDTNIKPLFYGTIGMRQMTNSVHEIKAPEDLEGLKIRVQNNPMHIAGMKALGSSPTPIAFGELFTSLQQGVVDGQENPLATIYDWKFYEVQDYLTLTNHLYTAGTLAINEDFYQSLPDDVKEAIDKAGKEASAFAHSEVKATENEYKKELAEIIQLYEPTQEELSAFQDAAKTAWPEMEEMIGKEYFNKILDAAGLK